MEKIKIGDVCDILNGYAFKSENYVDSGIRIIRIANVQKGYIEDTSPVFYPLNATGLDRYRLVKNDLLISLTGNVGRVALLDESLLPAALNQRVACLRLKTDKVTKKYLYHILNSDFFERQCIQAAKGVAQKNMSTEWLKDYEIPLCAKGEQEKIIKVLDCVQRIIVNYKQELQKLDELVKSRFIELFSGTFEVVSAEDVCSDIVDCPHSTPKYDEKELIYPAIRTSEIQNGSILWDSMKYVGVVEYEKRVKRLKPERGDVVYAREGTYGDCVILPDEYEFCLGQRTMLFRPDYKICTSAYLHAALRSDAVKKQADASNAGSTVPHVNVADAKKFYFPLPPLELQQQFAAFVEQVDKSKIAVQQALDKAQLLFDSLMQKYFG